MTHTYIKFIYFIIILSSIYIIRTKKIIKTKKKILEIRKNYKIKTFLFVKRGKKPKK